MTKSQLALYPLLAFSGGAIVIALSLYNDQTQEGCSHSSQVEKSCQRKLISIAKAENTCGSGENAKIQRQQVLCSLPVQLDLESVLGDMMFKQRQ